MDATHTSHAWTMPEWRWRGSWVFGGASKMECHVQYKSENLIAERNRRNKLNAKLYALRALVPNISKEN
ncbi:hypothetical protein ACLOJK_016296 [Asimina triloba]